MSGKDGGKDDDDGSDMAGDGRGPKTKPPEGGSRPEKGKEEKGMICACTHRDCWYVFEVKGEQVPERCPDCGKRTVRTAAPEEIAWFIREHRGKKRAG